MPRPLEEALKRRASEHGFKKGTPRYNAYVYGTLGLVEKHKHEHDDKAVASRTLRGSDATS